jgi:putative flippase GtrA
MRIHEVPVDWVDDPVSTVRVVSTACEDLKGILRMGSSLVRGKLPIAELTAEHGRTWSITDDAPAGLAGQVVRFCLVGLLSTAVFLLLFLSLRPECGAQLANILALVLAAVGNTAANRYFTFGIRVRDGAAGHHARGLVVFLFGLAVNAVTLTGAHALFGRHDTAVDVTALVVSSGLATVARFLMLRRWVFRTASSSAQKGPLEPFHHFPRQRTACNQPD